MARWQRLIGRPQPAVSLPIPTARPQGVDRRVSDAIRAAVNRLPFRANCLDQAVAASWMLRRRHVAAELVVGLDTQDPREPPHAWVVTSSGGAVVVGGGDVLDRFTAVTRFVSDA
jgi:hypothetical protein